MDPRGYLPRVAMGDRRTRSFPELDADRDVCCPTIPTVPRQDHRPVAVEPSAVEPFAVELERAVAGGVVLGRDVQGRVVLATGGLPGEEVTVTPDRVSARLVTGAVSTIDVRSPDRVEPPCPMVEVGCGGCDQQHASRRLQAEMAIEVVRDALAHTGSLPASLIESLIVEHRERPVRVDGRTTMRLAVLSDGRLGLRRHRSHESVAVTGCLVAHPLLSRTLAEGRFDDATEVRLRASVSTGEVLALVSPHARRARVPEGVRALGADELRRGARASITERVAGHDLRISARSFFQPGPVAAEMLGRAVRRSLVGFDADRDRLVDLYGGVGLFSVFLGSKRAEVVERSGSAVADARVNTAAIGSRVTRADVDSWTPSAADVVIADPPREGLGRSGVAAVVATGASRVCLVSCDPASLARDVSSLLGHGYEPTGIELVDMFPHTHHTEAVTALRRRSAGK